METALDLVNGCSLVELPLIHDSRGNLTFVEGGSHVPFEIRRVYYLYDVPEGEMRAGHAHHDLQQLVVAVGGSFDVLLDDGTTRRSVTLGNGHTGLLMSNAVWREISNFSPGAVCLVLASMAYDEADYIRDYDEFLRFVGGGQRSEVRRIALDGVGQHTTTDAT